MDSRVAHRFDDADGPAAGSEPLADAVHRVVHLDDGFDGADVESDGVQPDHVRQRPGGRHLVRRHARVRDEALARRDRLATEQGRIPIRAGPQANQSRAAVQSELRGAHGR